MEKYDYFTKITTDYLDGRLGGLDFKYEDKKHINVVINYKMGMYFWANYEISINLEEKHIDKAWHYSSDLINKAEFGREKKFEQAVSQFMFNS